MQFWPSGLAPRAMRGAFGRPAAAGCVFTDADQLQGAAVGGGGRIRRTAMESMTKRTPFVGNFIFVSRLSSQLPSVILAWNPRCDAEIKHLLVALRHPLSVFVAFATDE